MNKENIVIIFDGECILCDSFINFIVQRDKKNKFKLAYLQSEYFDNLPNEITQTVKSKTNNNEQKEFSSILLVEGNKSYNKSTAIIKIINHLGGAYHTILLFFIMPKFLRDIYYDFIGTRRYKWFGKKKICATNKEIQKRLIAK